MGNVWRKQLSLTWFWIVAAPIAMSCHPFIIIFKTTYDLGKLKDSLGWWVCFMSIYIDPFCFICNSDWKVTNFNMLFSFWSCMELLLPLWFMLNSNLFLKWQPKLIAISNSVTFAHPKAPLYPRLAQGKSWNEVSLSLVPWTGFLVVISIWLYWNKELGLLYFKCTLFLVQL